MGKLWNNHNKILKFIMEMVEVILGNAIQAYGVIAFIVPMNFIMGGTTGIALIFNHCFGMSISTITYIVNIGFFIVGILFVGKKFSFGIILSTILYPTFIWIFERIPNISYNGEDMMLCLLFAGAIIGVGGGLIIKSGSSSGGIEVLDIIIGNKTGISIALLINVTDMVILAFQLPYSDVDQVLYGILLTFVLTVALDKVLLLGQNRMQVTVISTKYEEIRDTVLKNLNLGCSMIDIHTGLKNTEQEAIMCVLSSRKLTEFYNRVLDIDDKAFIITANVSNVKGRGFSLPQEVVK